MNAQAAAMLPDAVFKSLAVIAIAFSMIYRKKKGVWPWE